MQWEIIPFGFIWSIKIVVIQFTLYTSTKLQLFSESLFSIWKKIESNQSHTVDCKIGIM